MEVDRRTEENKVKIYRIELNESDSFGEFIQEFEVRFMTCSRVAQLVDALLSMKMGPRETLRSYASRYWELYNEISGGNEKVVASTFQLELQDTEL